MTSLYYPVTFWGAPPVHTISSVAFCMNLARKDEKSKPSTPIVATGSREGQVALWHSDPEVFRFTFYVLLILMHFLTLNFFFFFLPSFSKKT